MNGSDRIDLAGASDIANALSSSRNEDNYATMRDMEPSTHHCSGPQAASSSIQKNKLAKIPGLIAVCTQLARLRKWKNFSAVGAFYVHVG